MGEDRADGGCGEACLPEAFRRRMERLLGPEYRAFSDSYGRDRSRGLYVNPLKRGGRGPEPAGEGGEGRAAGSGPRGDLRERFGLREIPWAENGYFYEPGTRPGRHPYHDAGVYYIQEPSAMAAAGLLAPEPGERILDLCAAPGGKTVQIAGRMGGRGLLVANEIRPDRALVLSRNVERMGIGACVVTNESPDRLAGAFPEFFDRILADAPCSGEGMFRKDETARREWSPEHVALCARRQAHILDCAARMLRPGGRLVYSTCTFSPEEDEGSVWNFLARHGEFSVEEPEFGVRFFSGTAGFSAGRPDWAGAPDRGERDGGPPEGDARGEEDPAGARAGRGREALAATVRIWPHRADGEGHFIAVLRKDGHGGSAVRTGKPGSAGQGGAGRTGDPRGDRPPRRPAGDRAARAAWRDFCESALAGGADGYVPGARAAEDGALCLHGDQLYLLPEGTRGLSGLKVLRAGLHLGTVRKNRLDPSHALALCLDRSRVKRWHDMDAEGAEIRRYLAGETLPAEDGGAADGWTLMLADGYSVGWAKKAGNVFKNHYPKGLRRSFPDGEDGRRGGGRAGGAYV